MKYKRIHVWNNCVTFTFAEDEESMPVDYSTYFSYGDIYAILKVEGHIRTLYYLRGHTSAHKLKSEMDMTKFNRQKRDRIITMESRSELNRMHEDIILKFAGAIMDERMTEGE